MVFTLWNGCNYESKKYCENGKISFNYNVNDIFSCAYVLCFYETINIR